MPEPPAHAASLTVLAGPLKGRRLVVDEAIDDVLIGSDPDCRLCLDAPGVSPIHARIWLDPDGATVYDTRSAGGVYVNDDRVDERAALYDGDILWLGPPAEDGSLMLQFRQPGGPARGAAPAAAPVDDSAAFEPAGIETPPPAAAAPIVADDDWLIEEVTAPAEEVAPDPEPAAVEDPLESVLDDGQAVAPDVPEPLPPAVPEEDFFVAEEAAAVETAAAPPPPPPPAVDDDMFEWGEPAIDEPPPPPAAALSAEAAAATPPVAFAAPSFEEEAAPSDPLMLDFGQDEWPPAAPAAPPPSPPPPPPVEDEDVFYVEEPEPMMAAPPAPPRPVSPVPAAPPMAVPPPPMAAAPPPMAAAAAPRPTPAPVPAPPPPPPPPAAPIAVLGGADAATPPAPRQRPSESMRAPAVPRPAPAAEAGGGRRTRGGSKRWIFVGAGLVVALAAGAMVARQIMGGPVLDTIEPTRVRAGDTIALRGRNFTGDAATVTVRFDGRREGRVLRAGPNRLEVEVPNMPTAPGRVNRVPVQVVIGGRESKPVEISVFQAPRIHGISPAVALAGEEVTLAGTDWGPGATVRFGGQEAQVIDVSPTALRVRVPNVTSPEGTRLPVVVSMGADPSNEVPFHLGRLPLLLSIQPAAASAGDLLVIKGLGFALQAAANDLRVGGARAVVVRASDGELQAVVPRTPADGPNAVELRVPTSSRVGQGEMTIVPPPDPVPFKFFVEHPTAAGITDPENGHDHVVLSTGLGPAFIISAAEGSSAAARAVEAALRLNDAAAALRATLTADLEVRGLDGQPSIGLVGKQEPLLTVTSEDAAAYDEPWAVGKGKAEPVSPARLATWWGAVARDLVLLLVRGERPRHAAALAPEGRPLGAVFDAARRTGKAGVPRETIAGPTAPLRTGVRTMALGVPAAVKGPVTAGTAAAPVQALRLDGTWSGFEAEGGATRYMTITFSGATGTFTYERALAVTIPLQSVQATSRRQAKFAFRSGMRLRQYDGNWDGQKLRGRITSEEGAEIGTFEIEKTR